MDADAKVDRRTNYRPLPPVNPRGRPEPASGTSEMPLWALLPGGKDEATLYDLAYFQGRFLVYFQGHLTEFYLFPRSKYINRSLEKLTFAAVNSKGFRSIPPGTSLKESFCSESCQKVAHV
jgi:hypothetical protein